MTDLSTRERLLLAANDLFYRRGFARVSVDAIAEAAGVTKRTLYYHFESKDALAGAVLDDQAERARARFEAWDLETLESAEAVVASLFAQLEDWASRPGWAGSGFTRLPAELADLPGHPARAAASRHKAVTEKRLAARLADVGADEPEVLAARVFILLEGGGALALIHGDVRYIREAGAAAAVLARRNGDVRRTAPRS